MFPASNDSQTIIDCFLSLAVQFRIVIKTRHEVLAVHKTPDLFLVKTNQGDFEAGSLICALGGHHKLSAYQPLIDLGHRIHPPIPSLFTFNLPQEPIKNELQGLSVQQAGISIAGSKLRYSGPVLVTHWGLSGPAILKLSAFAAIEFFEAAYHATILVNWADPLTGSEVEQALKKLQLEKHRALPYSNPAFNLPKRLWEFLCAKVGITNSRPWAEISRKQLNGLVAAIGNGPFTMEGKTTFKEEFVTCGGIDLKEVDFKTMQSKLVPGLFFCGEVLHVDGITGGFNFQSAWSTAWICANSCDA